MKQLIIILTLCVAFPSVSVAASIEQERMQKNIQQEQEGQQKQQEKEIHIYPFDTDLAAVKKEIENRKEDKPYMIVPTPIYNYLLQSGQIKKSE